MSKNKNKTLKSKPPFYWPLILMMIILLEIGMLMHERSWSRAIGNVVLELRDQLEKTKNENQLISYYIFKIYNSFLEFKNLTEAERTYLVNVRVLSLNNNVKKY